MFALDSDGEGPVCYAFIFISVLPFISRGAERVRFLGSLVKGLSFIFICRCDTTITKDIDVFLILVTQTLFTREVLCTIA